MNIQRLFALVTLSLATTALAAGPEPGAPIQDPCPHCEGQIVYRDVVCHRCKVVPGTRQIKKTIYEVKEVPFCLTKLPPLHHHKDCCCDDCVECDCPRYKKVLMKKEIVCEEVCAPKCVIEEYVERIPCRICCPDCPSCGKLSAEIAPAITTPVAASGQLNYYASPAVQPIAPPLADQELVPIPPVLAR
jgi:hypothetical protein